ISSIGVDGKTVTLAANGNESIAVDEGDRWQGVYRFDHYTVKSQVQVLSNDPIKVSTDQVVTGPVETDAIYADRLVVKSGGSVTQPLTTSAAMPSSLRIEVRELVVEAGGAIDVTSRGYAAGTTYPGHVNRTSASGGSHLGEGGPYAAVGDVWQRVLPAGERWWRRVLSRRRRDPHSGGAGAGGRIDPRQRGGWQPSGRGRLGVDRDGSAVGYGDDRG